AITAECARLEERGHRPYRIPLGGSSPVGGQGYVAAAHELEGQLPDSTVYVADGTGGTHAGLVAGFGDHGRVRGVDVGAVADIATAVTDLADDAACLAGLTSPVGTVSIDRSQVGDGYGRSTPAALDAIRIAGRHEGLVLDPVYTAKAFAALLADAERGSLPAGPVVYLHTGGMPGLLVARHAAAVVAASTGRE
ncbi:MAG: pyridoxal-phosphate dependent enzyme, partial [Actinomycetota bacterium]|nr:pyridoxal-phosphate dependent enzyme [Actinomycetota bacterium]